MSVSAAINQRIQRITRRAERVDAGTLAETFVAIGGVENILFNPENQIIFGRRGTGKTHALRFLQQKAADRNEAAVFIDLRTIGSNSSIYADTKRPISERITTLVVDVFGEAREALLELLTRPNTPFDLSRVAPKLDELADAISKIYVDDEVEERRTAAIKSSSGQESRAGAKLGQQGASLTLETKTGRGLQEAAEITTHSKGTHRYKVHFGTIASCFRDLAAALQTRLWLLLDEWSAIPEELQPYLADVLRRTVFPLPQVTVQIAAIEFRSVFQLSAGSDYTGIEVGADCSANINFDDFMVFENNPERSKTFFSRMLYQHFQATDPSGVDAVNLNSAAELINLTFTQHKAFDEFVRAAEGVPRDAINILALAATKAQEKKISIPHIRAAAAQWFDQDKSQVFKRNPDTELLLAWIMDKVIAGKRSRAFLVDLRGGHRLIEELLDARMIHVLKRAISGHDEPGVRYRVYKIDYGCYVELLKTAKAPEGLLLGENKKGEEQFFNVPPDDYRAIRRSILNMSEFSLEQLKMQLPMGQGFRVWQRSLFELFDTEKTVGLLGG
jgi:hypothetical protein